MLYNSSVWGRTCRKRTHPRPSTWNQLMQFCWIFCTFTPISLSLFLKPNMFFRFMSMQCLLEILIPRILHCTSSCVSFLKHPRISINLLLHRPCCCVCQSWRGYPDSLLWISKISWQSGVQTVYCLHNLPNAKNFSLLGCPKLGRTCNDPGCHCYTRVQRDARGQQTTLRA